MSSKFSQSVPKLVPDRLLAKSVEEPWKGAYSLVGHTANVVRAVTTLVDVLGDRLMTQFDLGCDLAYVRSTARLAAYIHDWGKANHHFQGVVRQKMVGASPQRNPLKYPQLLRHEIVSILLAWKFRDWLQQSDGDFLVALAAAGGHHLKLGGNQGKKTNNVGEVRTETGDDRLFLYPLHHDFKGLLKFGTSELGLPKQIKFASKPESVWVLSDIENRRLEIYKQALESWEPNIVLNAVVKSLLVAGDSIGSAISSTDLNLEHWIIESIEKGLTEVDLDRVINVRLEGKALRDFQKSIGDISSQVGLVRAGCGTGKTVGAYNWAKRHAIGRKLFFCYPTTGTSTEGFIDYVQDEVESVLMHSRAAIDLASTGEEREAGDNTENEATLKLQSFEAWESQVIICTVDTVLGLMQCNRRPMYCFPAIANAAFIFDEVHCYDKGLFGALLRFLETVKAPILLMSASFLPWQIRAIEWVSGGRLIEGENLIAGPRDLEDLRRYRFHESQEPDWERVENELKSGGKVLWVCNQVNTAIDVYDRALKRGLNAVLYHSRFCYRDRVQHHRHVVAAFKDDCHEPVLAICTQVAEMSLDLSATLLVSQVAEPAALIQRLGRLNRRYCGHALDAVFYDDPEILPYNQETKARGWALIRDCPGEVSQGDLARWLEQESKAIEPEKDFVLLDGEWRTYPAPVREAGMTVTALLEQHQATWGNLPHSKLGEYTVPLIASVKAVSQWKRHGGYLIAPIKEWDYTADRGAKKR
ncbi:MAG: CRISPR-associated helicase Cas3' [Limnothrix sp. CACIAM 69d]|nr:MAG: CRISPR-associated helicase Cas3' [Limnothrix sp. CACIAM 69d]